MQIQTVPYRNIQLAPESGLRQGDVQLSTDLLGFLNVARQLLSDGLGYGTTAQRPVNPQQGMVYYDTTLAEFVVCTAVRHGATAAVYTPVSGSPPATPAAGQISSATPSGTNSTTGVMMGVSSGTTVITPASSGRVMMIATGMAEGAAAGAGASMQIRYGSGNGPANGAALTGTTVGSLKNMVASTIAGRQGFACSGLVTGLTLATGYYIDLSLKAVTASPATIFDVDIAAFEF